MTPFAKSSASQPSDDRIEPFKLSTEPKAPAEMRSRVLGLLSVCIGLGPIGFLMLGGLAEALGAPAATTIMGATGLAVLALTRRWWRHI